MAQSFCGWNTPVAPARGIRHDEGCGSECVVQRLSFMARLSRPSGFGKWGARVPKVPACWRVLDGCRARRAYSQPRRVGFAGAIGLPFQRSQRPASQGSPAEREPIDALSTLRQAVGSSGPVLIASSARRAQEGPCLCPADEQQVAPGVEHAFDGTAEPGVLDRTSRTARRSSPSTTCLERDTGMPGSTASSVTCNSMLALCDPQPMAALVIGRWDMYAPMGQRVVLGGFAACVGRAPVKLAYILAGHRMRAVEDPGRQSTGWSVSR